MHFWQELSGLGDRKGLNATCIQDRYQNVNVLAQTRSVIALGLATFNKKEGQQYQVETFNITVLCSEAFIVDPESVQFLVEHGFDFQKQYSQGIHYYRGNDKVRI